MVFGTSNLTTADLIRQTLGHVQGSVRSPANRLADAFTSMQTNMVFSSPVSGVQIGQAIEVGLTLYQVTDVDTATKTLGVVPVDEATDHDAGAVVRMRPAYTKKRIIDEFNAELSDLSTQDLYRVVTIETDNDGVTAVPAGAVTVLDVWTNEPSLAYVASRQFPEALYQIVDTPDGLELRGPATSINPDFVVFGCAFNELPLDDDTVDVVDTTGLWGQALDLLPLGVAVRLLMGTESQRNSITGQGNSRRADEVPPAAVTGSMRSLASLRQQRLVAEQGRLRQRFGYTKRVGP